ncbi:hypothetical protein AVEN_74149-1 [Araneus ventricosus]|uniref:Uncharacterized protein n=1 Tax=Araneus ventricosus TaxID=182803 RepID=A0A4Y2J0Z9_ARAVE|nr:hypothetical protein AVEN_74149-1 [Araneus ventricosus]
MELLFRRSYAHEPVARAIRKSQVRVRTQGERHKQISEQKSPAIAYKLGKLRGDHGCWEASRRSPVTPPGGRPSPSLAPPTSLLSA